MPQALGTRLGGQALASGEAGGKWRKGQQRGNRRPGRSPCCTFVTGRHTSGRRRIDATDYWGTDYGTFGRRTIVSGCNH